MKAKNFDSIQPETNSTERSTGLDNVPKDKQAEKYKIPVDDIKAMINKYKTERQELVNVNPTLRNSYGNQFSDTRSVWFSIDELKNFISEAENENPGNKLNGLRMYFVVYPEKQNVESDYLRAVPENLRNQTSLVLIPTYYDSTNKLTRDFSPSSSPSQAAGSGAERRLPQLTTLAMNHGALCPPGCPTEENEIKATYL